MHLDAERIERALHGELDPAQSEAVARHVAACEPCRRSLEDARREEESIFDALRELDRPAPAASAEAIAARARRGSRGWMRRAAGVLIAVSAAAAAAYAIPGSPVRGWVAGLAARFAEPGAPAPIETSPAPPPASGIAVAPTDRFAIRFATPQSAGTLTVVFTDGADVVARAHSGTASFTTEADGLVVENRGSTASYEIEIPNGARWVEVLVGERRLLLKDGDHVITDARADARGRFVMPIATAGP